MSSVNENAGAGWVSLLAEVLDMPVMRSVQRMAAAEGVQAYLVGGFVRDMLLNRPSKDIDIMVVGSGLAFAEAVAQDMDIRNRLTVFKTFGTAQLRTPEIEVEFVGARKESYDRNSRKPFVEEGSLEDDLSRRDFTINALAVSLNKGDQGQIIDLFNGLQDLHDGILRTPLDPDITFSDDPLRMMRAVRFASQLGFVLHTETHKAISRNRERIAIISAERISDELNKIILSPVPSLGFKLLDEVGLLPLIFPELLKLKGTKTIENKSHKDNFYHTLQVLDNISPHTQDLWLRWAAILHDIGKPASQRFDKLQGWTFHGHEVIGARMVRSIFRKLKLPQNEKMKYVEKLVLLHLRPIALTQDVSDSAIRRLIVDAGEDIEDLLTLCRADITSKIPEKVKRYLQRFENVWEKIKIVEEKDKLRNWKPPITGEHIIEYFNITPSKPVGIIKDEIKEAILNGDIPNEYEPAHALMLEIGERLGLKPRIKS